MSRRVALLNFGFWPEVQRGSERIVHDLAADLAARGHHMRVVTTHAGPSRASDEDGFEVVRNRRPPETVFALRRFEGPLAHVPLSYRTLARGDDELAHAFYPTDALAAVAWSRRSGRPAVFSYMGLPHRGVTANRRGRMRIVERVTRDSAAVVGLSRAACDGLWRWWGIDPVLIHPGVSLAAYSERYERAEHPTIACAASPDDERKRIPLLVEAFARVRREHPRARLQIVRPRSEHIAAQLAGDGIELYDPSPAAVPEIFGRAWASALPSFAEAFGLVVVESLAAGTPVVAADEGGPAEILAGHEGIGVLFEEPEPEPVARALLSALELSQDAATADACRARAADFTSERCAIEHELLYEELLSR